MYARIPASVRRNDIRGGRPLRIAILAVVETIFWANSNAERRAETVARDIAAATKWTRVKFHVDHVLSLPNVRGCLLFLPRQSANAKL